MDNPYIEEPFLVAQRTFQLTVYFTESLFFSMKNIKKNLKNLTLQ